MSDQPRISSDPADTSPAEGQSHPIPAADKGKGTGGLDTADRAPAEGSREGDTSDLSSAADNAQAAGRE